MSSPNSNSFMLPSRYQPITQSLILGGFGSVRQVRDTFLDRPVLFKSMQDRTNNAQLVNEIQALSKARSRHVVEIYDVIRDEQGDVVGIIIELLTGRDYSQFYTEDKSNSHEYLRVLYQIATALNDLHSTGVVHRDLKLDNLRSSASGILKLFDFGISVAGENYRTRNNRGTFVYAAPELFITDAEITPKMDIYAFGICAWALVTNNWPPVLRERPPQKTGRAPSIASVFPGLPVEVVQLIDACLHTDPNLRPHAHILSREFARQLVRGKHRGIFVQGDSEIYELSNNKPHVRITIGNLGALKVTYDGLVFCIAEVVGNVYVNNEVAAVNMELHESCVLTFGAPDSGSLRSFVSFASSHPEVVL